MSGKRKGLSLTLINLLVFTALVKVREKGGGVENKEVKYSNSVQSFSFSDNESNDGGDGIKVP